MEFVGRSAGEAVMSTDKATPDNADARLASKGFRPENAATGKGPTVEKMEIADLAIDEAYDADCDPYNSNGQFLTEALKKKFDSR